MISSPGCVCLGAVVPGASSTIVWTTASSDAQVVPLEVDAPGSHLLCLRHVERQAGGGDQRRDCHDSSRFHDHSFRPFHVIHAAIGTMPSAALEQERLQEPEWQRGSGERDADPRVATRREGAQSSAARTLSR